MITLVGWNCTTLDQKGISNDILCKHCILSSTFNVASKELHLPTYYSATTEGIHRNSCTSSKLCIVRIDSTKRIGK